MRVYLVLAHPSRKSFTHALADSFAGGLASAGHTHEVEDLYASGFNPVAAAKEVSGWRHPAPADVLAQQTRLTAAQGLALIYPVWWATPPAMLQGWMQRVLTEGFAFEYKKHRAHGLLTHRAQLIVNVGSRDAALFDNYVRPLIGVLNYCGIDEVRPLVNWGIHPATPEDVRAQALKAAFEAGAAF